MPDVFVASKLLTQKVLRFWSTNKERLQKVRQNGRLPAYLVSLCFHVVLLSVLATIHYASVVSRTPPAALETVLLEELPVQPDLIQRLDANVQVSDTPNVTPSGAPFSTNVSVKPTSVIQEEQISVPKTVAEPDVPLAVAELPPPSDEILTADLDVKEVAGETGVSVEGYGPALSRLTQELLRLMRKDKLLVVWLFDESYSMKSDQQMISQQLNKVYEELRIQQERDESLRLRKSLMLTAIAGFGQQLHLILDKPTPDLTKIRTAIANIPVDESGEERMCSAVITVSKKYGKMASRQKRRLVLIVVTDESPYDSALLEKAVSEVKRFRSPVYILGREAMFGTAFAQVHWQDPQYHLDHKVELTRGPESAYIECLQFDGTGKRPFSFPCGFGPYDQMRLARESGGIFFILPVHDEKLVGFEEVPPPRFDPFALKEYQPQLVSRKQYTALRNRSRFRSAVWNVINTLDPDRSPELTLRTWGFPVNFEAFRREAQKEILKALRLVPVLEGCLKTLENVRPLRETEPLRRWRANYDLIRAQCLAYHIRLSQYILALDRQAAHLRRPSNPESNQWNLYFSSELIRPDPPQFERLRRLYRVREIREEYLNRLSREVKAADRAYKFVETEHPDTPWAFRARRERSRGYGFRFEEFHGKTKQELEREPKVRVPKF